MEAGALPGGQSVIEHVVFLLEEPSAQDFLQGVLPGILPAIMERHFLVFEGKQDLEKQLVRRLKGWRRPNTRFIVIRDQDSGDCVAVKRRLQELCGSAGRPDAIVRIACREIEAFFVGDWQAVAQAFGKPGLRDNDRRAKFRDPDLLGSPSHELMRVIPGYQKRSGARNIAPFLRPERNRSDSFHALVRALGQLAAA